MRIWLVETLRLISDNRVTDVSSTRLTISVLPCWDTLFINNSCYDRVVAMLEIAGIDVESVSDQRQSVSLTAIWPDAIRLM